MKDLPIVLITGCSSGFGFALVQQLAPQCQVIATYRQESTAQELLALQQKYPETITCKLLDVTYADQQQEVVDWIQTQFGRLDVLINNAGIAVVGYSDDISDEMFSSVISTNFLGVVTLTNRCLPLLRKSQRAQVIVMSSIAGLTSFPLMSAYNASKYAVEGWAESIRYELSRESIDVVLIEPGTYQTNILDRNLIIEKGLHLAQSAHVQDHESIEKIAHRSKQRCNYDPRDVARIIAHIIHKKPRQFRYILKFSAKCRFVLSRYVPFRFREWVVLKGLRWMLGR